LKFDGDHRVGDIQEYRKKLVWGIYSENLHVYFASAGYHDFTCGEYQWYRLGVSKLSTDALFYFPWNWFLQIDVGEAFDPNDQDAEYEVWACLKFTGAAFPNGKAEDTDAIYFQRLVLVKK